MTKNLKFDFSLSPSPADLNFYYERVSKLNKQHGIKFENLGSTDRQYFFLRNEKQLIVGGSSFYIDYDFLGLDMIWVEEDLKRLGYGARIFLEVENYAIKMKCNRILLSTFDFQNALPIWQKWGFEIIGHVPDCPQGYNLYYLTKKLFSAAK